ncbi:MAG TPA: UDP-N-acetylmuramate--L-alanine ligase [Planctomycetaceae bacterium]|jgi:UDP-N-acetylmuramate--alanine ligase|nr:UDP-N-acetylmuramate--L-alanine ligase [Planctomycetaceae bacterium]
MAQASDFLSLYQIRNAGTPSTEPGLSAHFVGICGAGMNALASMLLDLGWSVTGSDLHPTEPLSQDFSRRGVKVQRGHDPCHLPPRTDVLVYSAAIPVNNPEREAARSLNIPEMAYSRMLGELMRSRRGVCIAGTHGKSTTAAMVASILLKSGREPSACIGAELCELGKSGWAGSGDLLVVESCEYRHSFLDLSPTCAAILSVEPDHFDCFREFGETCEAFHQFAARVLPTGFLVVRGDCAAAVAAARGSSARVETFSLATGSDWCASELRPTADGIRFAAFRGGAFFSEFSLMVPGRHNVLNALAAIALCHHLGVSSDEMVSSLARFAGVRRRFEHRGTWRGVTLLDDYAHHPTEVQATLKAARERFGCRRLWCVFQPHQVSRTRALFREFAESFTLADELLVAPVYAARETSDTNGGFIANELALTVAAAGVHARFCPDLDRIMATLEDEARPGDVVMTMGAGDIDRVHHEFTRPLQRHRAS